MAWPKAQQLLQTKFLYEKKSSNFFEICINLLVRKIRFYAQKLEPHFWEQYGQNVLVSIRINDNWNYGSLAIYVLDKQILTCEVYSLIICVEIHSRLNFFLKV